MLPGATGAPIPACSNKSRQLRIHLPVHARSSVLQPGYALKLSLPEGDRNLDDKLDIVETEGLGATQTHVLTPGEAPSETMMAFLRLIQLQGGCWLDG